MQANPREKKFDAVKMMRDIRDKLSEKYLESPELEEKDLEAIRREYGTNLKEKVKYQGLTSAKTRAVVAKNAITSKSRNLFTERDD